MPVNIPGPPNLPSGISRPATLTIAATAPVPLATGERATAQVLKAAPIDATLGAKLLQTPTNNDAPTGGQSAREALLGQYRTAMARNEMHLAALLIKGKRVTTVIDQPLAKGQRLEVLLGADNRLSVITDKLPNTANPRETSLTRTSALLGALKPVLRELLPQQGRPQLLDALNSLPSSASLPSALGNRQHVSTLLGHIERIALDLNAPPSGKAVRQALEQSGTLLEPRLARATQEPSPEAAIKEVLTRDLKAALLQYLAPSKTDSSAATAATRNAPTAYSAPSALTPGALTLPSLMQMLGNHRPEQGGESLRQLQTQLIMLMQQLSASSLARVRLNQLQPEAHSTRAGEAANPAPLSFDIPVRFDGQLHPAHIEIEEHPEPEGESQEDDPQEKLWQVNLTLEPPGIGEFFVRLRLRAEQLSLGFWSEQQLTLAKAQQAFKGIRATLEAHNIEVRDVQFHHAAPPYRGNHLSYHLVDVQT